MDQKPQAVTRPLSEAIARPLRDLSHAGRLSVSLILSGLVLIAASMMPWFHDIRNWLAGIGCLVILPVPARFLFIDLRRIRETGRRIEENSELIDLFQRTAVEITDFTIWMEKAILENGSRTAGGLDRIRDYVLKSEEIREKVMELTGHPLLSRLGAVRGIRKIVGSEGIERFRDTTLLTAEFLRGLERVAGESAGLAVEFREALSEADLLKLKGLQGRLMEHGERIQEMVTQGTRGAA